MPRIEAAGLPMTELGVWRFTHCAGTALPFVQQYGSSAAKPTGVPRKRIKVGPVLFEDRPMCMLMVPVNDVTLAVAAVVIVWIDFPHDVFSVLLIQRTVCIDARVYENAVSIDIHQR